jgi:hypothetical protein
MKKIKDEGYVDLDKEVVLRKDGTRLTEAEAEKLGRKIADRAHAKRAKAGRPSLSGKPAKSPQLGVRVPAATRAKLERRAAREGKNVSDVVRDAIERYI